MSIYDRDWYKDHAKKRDAAEAGSMPGPAPAQAREASPPKKDPGLEIFGDWHWSLIAIFWVVLALVLAAGFKYFR